MEFTCFNQENVIEFIISTIATILVLGEVIWYFKSIIDHIHHSIYHLPSAISSLWLIFLRYHMATQQIHCRCQCHKNYSWTFSKMTVIMLSADMNELVATEEHQVVPSILVCTDSINSSSPGQNGCHFADNIFKNVFVNERFCILIKNSLKFYSKGLIDHNQALL